MPRIRRTLGVLATAFCLCTPITATAGSLFGTVEFRANSLAGLPQWQRVLARIEDERPTYDACARTPAACPSRGAMAWQAMLSGLKGEDTLDQARAINRFANRWPYTPDMSNYGRSDQWATPLEFLRRSGDCEDYAIAKYVSLRQLGVPADHLRVVVVQDVLRNLAHAVLAVFIDDDVYVLDNLTNAVLPQQRVTQYVPYYSINEASRWAHVPVARTLVSSAGGSKRHGG